MPLFNFCFKHKFLMYFILLCNIHIYFKMKFENEFLFKTLVNGIIQYILFQKKNAYFNICE